MDVLVAGGHGQIARRLLRLLAQRGHNARGLIRNPDHAEDLEADGAQPVLCDLERDDVRPHVGGADAIVFAAGAGPGSGAERKGTMDYGGAVKCIEAAEELGVSRFLMVRIEQGLADTTVFPNFTADLDKELYGNGVKVSYKTYEGVDHAGAVTAKAPARNATEFIKARLG